MVVLPKLNENVELLEKICASFDLQPRGSAGEHSAAVGGKVRQMERKEKKWVG